MKSKPTFRILHELALGSLMCLFCGQITLAQESVPAALTATIYPTTKVSWFFEIGSSAHDGSSILLDKNRFIPMQPMNASGLSINQGFIVSMMQTEQSSFNFGLSMNTDFTSFKGRQTMSVDALPFAEFYNIYRSYNKLPSAGEQPQQRTLLVEQDFSGTFIFINLSATYRHKISMFSLEAGLEAMGLVSQGLRLRQDYQVMLNGEQEAEGEIGACPKDWDKLPNVSIPLNLISGIGVDILQNSRLYARYYHPLTSLLQHQTWLNSRFAVGVEFSVEDMSALEETAE
jgi:hypothetical protein